jgi:hypothetical protein
MSYEIKSKKRTYQVHTSRIPLTNYTRYEVFHNEVKVGGMIQPPDSDYCDSMYFLSRETNELHSRKGKGYGYAK